VLSESEQSHHVAYRRHPIETPLAPAITHSPTEANYRRASSRHEPAVQRSPNIVAAPIRGGTDM